MADISKIKLNNVDYDIKDIIARNNISTINNDISLLKTRKYLMIGDSYAKGDGQVPQGWCAQVASNLGLTAGVNYFYSVKGGSGFSTSLTEKFQTRIQEAVNSLSTDVKNTITDIVIAGGWNDHYFRNTTSTIDSGMDNCSALIKANFPNAKVWLIPLGYDNIPTVRDDLHQIYDLVYARKSAQLGWTYVDGAQFSLIPPYIQADNTHPNANGDYILGCAISSILTGGTAYKNIPFNTLSINNREIGSVSLYNGYITITTFYESLSITLSSLGNDFITIGSFACDSIAGCESVNKGAFSIPVVIHGSDGYHEYMLDIALVRESNNRVVKGRIVKCNAEGNNYYTIPNVDQIQIPPFTVTMPAYLLS